MTGITSPHGRGHSPGGSTHSPPDRRVPRPAGGPTHHASRLSRHPQVGDAQVQPNPVGTHSPLPTDNLRILLHLAGQGPPDSHLNKMLQQKWLVQLTQAPPPVSQWLASTVHENVNLLLESYLPTLLHEGLVGVPPELVGPYLAHLCRRPYPPVPDLKPLSLGDNSSNPADHPLAPSAAAAALPILQSAAAHRMAPSGPSGYASDTFASPQGGPLPSFNPQPDLGAALRAIFHKPLHQPPHQPLASANSPGDLPPGQRTAPPSGRAWGQKAPSQSAATIPILDAAKQMELPIKGLGGHARLQEQASDDLAKPAARSPEMMRLPVHSTAGWEDPLYGDQWQASPLTGPTHQPTHVQDQGRHAGFSGPDAERLLKQSRELAWAQLPDPEVLPKETASKQLQSSQSEQPDDTAADFLRHAQLALPPGQSCLCMPCVAGLCMAMLCVIS